MFELLAEAAETDEFGFVYFVLPIILGFGIYALIVGCNHLATTGCPKCKSRNHPQASICRSCGGKIDG